MHLILKPTKSAILGDSHTCTLAHKFVHIVCLWYQITTNTVSPLVYIVSSALTAVDVLLLCPHSAIIYQPSAAEKVQDRNGDNQVIGGARADKGKEIKHEKEYFEFLSFFFFLSFTEITLTMQVSETFLLNCVFKLNQLHINLLHGHIYV